MTLVEPPARGLPTAANRPPTQRVSVLKDRMLWQPRRVGLAVAGAGS